MTTARLQTMFAGVATKSIKDFAVYVERPAHGYSTHRLHHAPWLDGSHDALEILHLSRSVLPFVQRSRFPQLTVLHIHGQAAYWHSVDVLSAIIRASPVLHTVILQRLICGGFVDSNVREITSTSITSLDLGLGGGNVTSLAALFRFPALSKLAVRASEFSHVQDLLSLPPSLFAPVATLTIYNAQCWPFDVSLSQFLALFPALTTLDLTHSATAFPVVLSAAIQHSVQHSSNLIPLLACLTLKHAALDDIKTFAILYGARESSDGGHMVLRSIHTVVGTAATRANYTSLCAWLRTHVSDFGIHPVTSKVSARLTV
ncbi:hypothetical protein DFH06DRAFT_1142113 [Mycena polygramma]|nr:hypothetical protein DFH06DRAFT_1142113 [Mycena polygramma]